MKCQSKSQWSITSHLLGGWMLSKRNSKHWQGFGEMGTPAQWRWNCKLMHPLRKTLCKFLKKFYKVKLHAPVMPFLDIYLKEIKSLSRHLHPHVHCGTISLSRPGNNLGLYQRMKKMWLIYTFITAINRRIYHLQQHANEVIGLSEISQRERETNTVWSHLPVNS